MFTRFNNPSIKTQHTLIKLVYSSFNLWTQASLSRGPAFVFKVGIDATVRFVASSTIFESFLIRGILHVKRHRILEPRSYAVNTDVLEYLRVSCFSSGSLQLEK